MYPSYLIHNLPGRNSFLRVRVLQTQSQGSCPVGSSWPGFGPQFHMFSVLSWFFLCKSVVSGCCLFVQGLSLSSLSSASLSTLFLSVSCDFCSPCLWVAPLPGFLCASFSPHLSHSCPSVSIPPALPLSVSGWPAWPPDWVFPAVHVCLQVPCFPA